MGWDSVHIDNCYVSGSIKTNGSGTGGVAAMLAGWGSTATKGDGTASVTNCYSDAIIYDVNPTAYNMKKGEIVGLQWSGMSGTHYLVNCASKNGTSFNTLAGVLSNSNSIFTEAANANTVKTSVLSATSDAGAHISTIYTPPNTSEYQNYYEIGLAIQEGRVLTVDGMEDNSEWLTNMINNGSILLQKKDANGNYYDTSVATDTSLQEVSNETKLKKAEAQYEADMKRIDLKDRKYDTDLAALDTERNAIKQEMDTLKTVAKDNVERTFKLFG